MMQRNAFLQKGQLLTRRRSCDRVDNVNGDEGNKYHEVFCPEKSRLVQGITEQQGKYLPERMTLRHTRGPLASHGQDSVEFYISTNPGEAPKPLAKIASGGELSRITLAIKNAMADKDAVPTVIYDEIDSGVSGKAAGRIGEVLRQSAQGHQILCITHTAQIAALADCHLLIQKNVSNERTYTEIHPLDENGRVEALARLISGDHVTELSRANAREMLQERKHGG